MLARYERKLRRSLIRELQFLNVVSEVQYYLNWFLLRILSVVDVDVRLELVTVTHDLLSALGKGLYEVLTRRILIVDISPQGKCFITFLCPDGMFCSIALPVSVGPIFFSKCLRNVRCYSIYNCLGVWFV